MDKYYTPTLKDKIDRWAAVQGYRCVDWATQQNYKKDFCVFHYVGAIVIRDVVITQNKKGIWTARSYSNFSDRPVTKNVVTSLDDVKKICENFRPTREEHDRFDLLAQEANRDDEYEATLDDMLDEMKQESILGKGLSDELSSEDM